MKYNYSKAKTYSLEEYMKKYSYDFVEIENEGYEEFLVFRKKYSLVKNFVPIIIPWHKKDCLKNDNFSIAENIIVSDDTGIYMISAVVSNNNKTIEI